jgi:hypothetical protein
VVPSPVTPSKTTTTDSRLTPFRNENSFEAGSDWLQDAVLDDSDPFGLASFQFDEFPSLIPFWPDPLFQSPPAGLSLHSLTMGFDDFDRSRMLHDLEDVPYQYKGELPSCARLSAILRQYFQYVSPYTPVIHVPSFGVKTSPTPFLLLLLAIGDMYSEQQTLERWARKSFRYLLRLEVEKYETSESTLSLTTIQALNMWVYELVYISSDETKSVLQAAHCRATLSYACQKLQQDEELYRTRKQDGDDEIAWISWIRSETRRRTLMSIYTTETVISMYLSVAPHLRVSQLKIPLPEADELWYAESHQKWQQLRRLGRRGPSIQFNEVLSDLMNAGNLIREYNGVVGLHVVMIGIEELIVMARRLREVDGEGHVCSRALMAKSREALEAWKSSWQESQSQRATTKAQYIAIMSAWCCAELSLTAPDVLLGMVYRVSTTKDQAALMKKFLREVDDATKHLDLNQLLSTAAAAISHVESLAEFGSVEECLSVIETTVYPSVITSIFEGGLTLWFSVRILERIARHVPRAEKEILPRLLKAVDSIGWATHLRKNSIAALLGEILIQMKVWSKYSVEFH